MADDDLTHDPLAPWSSGSLGDVLSRFRKRAGLTGTNLAKSTGMSQSKISRLENGRAVPTGEELEKIAAALGLSATDRRVLLEAHWPAEALVGWRPDPRDIALRQREIARIESSSAVIRSFHPLAVVGLLQTSEYARGILTTVHTLFESGDGEPESEAVLQSVAGRMLRQRVLAEPGRRFHLVMPESVLGNRICPPEQMLAQIQRIREVAKKRDNVTIALVPREARWPVVGPGFSLYDDHAVLIDLPNSPVVLTGNSDVGLYRKLFDMIETTTTTEIDPILDRYLDMYYELGRSRRP